MGILQDTPRILLNMFLTFTNRGDRGSKEQIMEKHLGSAVKRKVITRRFYVGIFLSALSGEVGPSSFVGCHHKSSRPILLQLQHCVKITWRACQL